MPEHSRWAARLVLEIRALAEDDVDIAMPLIDVDDTSMLGTFHVLENQVRPDYPDQDRPSLVATTRA